MSKLLLVTDATDATVGIERRASMNIAVGAIRYAYRLSCARRGVPCNLDEACSIDDEIEAAQHVLLHVMQSGSDDRPASLSIRELHELCARISAGERGLQ